MLAGFRAARDRASQLEGGIPCLSEPLQAAFDYVFRFRSIALGLGWLSQQFFKVGDYEQLSQREQDWAQSNFPADRVQIWHTATAKEAVEFFVLPAADDFEIHEDVALVRLKFKIQTAFKNFLDGPDVG
jgi:hypothetical protein